MYRAVDMSFLLQIQMGFGGQWSIRFSSSISRVSWKIALTSSVSASFSRWRMTQSRGRPLGCIFVCSLDRPNSRRRSTRTRLRSCTHPLSRRCLLCQRLLIPWLKIDIGHETNASRCSRCCVCTFWKSKQLHVFSVELTNGVEVRRTHAAEILIYIGKDGRRSKCDKFHGACAVRLRKIWIAKSAD